MNAKTYFLYGIACIIFVICSCFLYNQISSSEPHCDIDSKAYLERGFLLATTGSFVRPTSPEQPYYALGYAGIIGTLYTIFWPSVTLIILFQLLLALLSCFLMMRCARLLFGNNASAAAALFFVTSIGYIVFVQFVLTEIVLAFFLLVSFERLLTWMGSMQGSFNFVHGSIHPSSHNATTDTHHERIKFIPFALSDTARYRIEGSPRTVLCNLPLAAAALALGLSIIIKPAALYSIVLLAPLIAGVYGTRWQRLGRVMLFTVFFYIPVVGYMTYNYHAFGNFRVSTLDRVNIYYWFFPNVLAHLHHTTSAFERNELIARSQGAHNFAAVEDLFWQSLRENPTAFMYVWCKNVVKTFAGLYTTNLKVLIAPSVYDGGVSFFATSGNFLTRMCTYITVGSRMPWVVAVGIFEACWSLLRYLLVILTCGALIRRKEFLLVALCGAYIAYFSLITGHDGCARFRMMFEFLLIILAAGGLSVMKRILMPFVWFDTSTCARATVATHHERAIAFRSPRVFDVAFAKSNVSRGANTYI